MLALQEALINKICKEKGEKDKILKEIADLQKLSKKEFLDWAKGREKYYTDQQKVIIDIFEKMIENDMDQ
jgi:secreted Zn-dependent insulinase-like peptidase